MLTFIESNEAHLIEIWRECHEAHQRWPINPFFPRASEALTSGKPLTTTRKRP